MPCCEIIDCAQMSKTIIAVRHFGLGGRESLETAVNGKKFWGVFFACILLSVNIEYLVSLYSSLHSYNKQFTSWLVHLYDFYYSLAVKGR